MRSVTSGILGQLTAQGSFPGWLVEITLTDSTVLRFTSLDLGFTFGGFTWASFDIELPDISWDGSSLKAAKIVFGDSQLSIWAYVLNLLLADVPIRIWAIFSAASGEAEPVWSGRSGRCSRVGITVEVELTNNSDIVTSPRTRVQQVVNPAFLIPGGTVMLIGGQRWIIDRPTSAS